MRKRNTKFSKAKSTAEDRRLAGRLRWNKANFIAGTIAPAKGNAETNSMEDIAHALTHYVSRGVTDLVIQVKHMGSRAQLYLHREIEKSYVITRNGNRLEIPERYMGEAVDRDGNPHEGEALEKWHEDKAYFEERQAQLDKAILEQWERHFLHGSLEHVRIIILDCELMPWHYLAKDLIQREFSDIGTLCRMEVETIAAFGFYKDEPVGSEDVGMYADYDYAVEQIDAYSAQVELFGSPGPVKLEVFNCLKIVYMDGQEDMMMDRNAYNSVRFGTGPYCRVDATNVEDLLEYPAFVEFMDQVKETGLEGVVVKPANYEYVKGLGCPAPYIKVRNPEYLRIIYGIDYMEPAIHASLIKGKNIAHKVQASVNQYLRGKELLKIPYAEIEASTADDSKLYNKLLGTVTVNNNEDGQLDSRL